MGMRLAPGQVLASVPGRRRRELHRARNEDGERVRGVRAEAVSDETGAREGQRGGEEADEAAEKAGMESSRRSAPEWREAEPGGGEEDPPQG